jgi:hypothetical protein
MAFGRVGPRLPYHDKKIDETAGLADRLENRGDFARLTFGSESTMRGFKSGRALCVKEDARRPD